MVDGLVALKAPAAATRGKTREERITRVVDDTTLNEVKEHFQQDGFAPMPGFVGAEEVAQVNERVDRYIADVLPGLPTSEALFEDADDPESLMRLSHMEKHDGFFASWYHDARFTGAAAALLGDDIVYTSVQLFDKPPRLGKLTPPHQDGFYFMLEPNEAITLWISLHPSDGQNGCMHFVAGSHRRGIRPHQRSNVLGFSQGITDFGADDEAAEVAVETRPGDVIAHHSMTIHRTGSNPTERRRRALGLVYFAKRAQHDAERAAAYQEELYKAWEEAGKI